MTALPVAAPSLSLLPALRPAAAAALDVQPHELVARWLAGLSAATRALYSRSLARFARWALSNDHRPERALQALCEAGAVGAAEMVRRWRSDDLEASGLASGSVAVYVSAIASLVAAARRAGLCSFKLEGVLPRVEQRHDRRGPRRADMERLVGTVDDRAEAGDRLAIRDAVLVRLLYVCGLRRAEAASLRVENVDLAAGIARIRRKGRSELRDVLLSSRTVAAIERWLQVRGNAPGFLLVGRGGDGSAPMAGESIRKALRAWQRRARVRATVRPHGCRHAGASEIAKRGSLAELLAYGQWASLTAARRYLDDRQEERASALRQLDL